MLSSLHIRNYILINSLDISFPEGLIIITGQTGAGKSILLGALSLLAGAKADSGAIAEGAESCVVEAQYSNIDSEEVKSLLEREDIEFCDNSLIIRRTVSVSGRSRCFVNDSPVSLAFLSELSSYLVDIHSQHSSLLLANKAFQLSVLDNFADNSVFLCNCRKLWKELQTSKNELVKLRTSLSRIQSEKDFDSAQLKQLEAARITSEDELELLEKEQKTLAYAEAIKEGLQTSLENFSPSSEGVIGICQGLKDAVKSLERISKYLPEIPSLIERMEGVKFEIEDIESELSSLDSLLDVSPERLETVEDRMSALYSLMKKHGCANLSELIEVGEELKNKLLDSSNLEDRIEELEIKINKLTEQWEGVAATLHKRRSEAAPRLSALIKSDLHFLELEKSEFIIEVQEKDACAEGIDSVQYLFSANGTKLQDVSKVASGGELSRIMLCLKGAMAQFMCMPTLIFDEIDTGVSGSVADKIGQMICTMGQNIQVLSITHLPQVAAKGNAHYIVSKSTDEAGKTTSQLSRIQDKERIQEIARLLSGSSISPEAIANAQSLLREANKL